MIPDLREQYGPFDHSKLTRRLLCEVHSNYVHLSTKTPALAITQWASQAIDDVTVDKLRVKIFRTQSQKQKLRGTKLTTFLDEVFHLPTTVTRPPLTTIDTNVTVTAGATVENAAAEFLPEVCDCRHKEVATQTSRTTAEQKALNTLMYDVSTVQKHLKKLEVQVEEKKKNLLYHTTYYNPINVRRREKHTSTLVSRLRLKNNSLTKELRRMREKMAQSEECKNKEMEEKDKELSRTNKLKSYYKRKSEGKAQEPPRKKSRLIELHRKVEKLQNDLDSIQTEEENPDLRTGHVFSDSLRLCVMQLLALEVAITKVSSVIAVVSKHLFNTTIKKKNLPSRQSVLRMSDEAHFLIKAFYSDKITAATAVGINRDGTSRKKEKILDTTITVNDSSNLALGFRVTAREDAESITNNTIKELEEIVLCNTSTEPETAREAILEKLNYVMSDRAANEKKAGRQLAAWVEDERLKAKLPASTLYIIHCMTHVLLAFHQYGMKEVMKLQSTVSAEGGPLGRDADGTYHFFKKENAVSRVVRVTSELLGPNCDEKNGIRDKWVTDCTLRQAKSLIGDYKDNRFNGIFTVAAQLMFHIDDILGLEKRLKSSNLKVKSMFLDLKDSRLVTMIQAVAILYVQVTEPYWRLTASKEVPYLLLYKHIEPFYRKLLQYTETPALLLDEHEVALHAFPPNTESKLYATSLHLRHQDRTDLALKTLKACVLGFIHAVENQLSEFLEGGKFYSIDDQTALKKTEGSGLNNLCCERNFGSLDSSQKRRRHATLHYHSTILLLKTNHTQLMNWITNKTPSEQKELLLKAKKSGNWLRQKHRAEEKNQRKAQEALLLEEPRRKKGLQAAASKLLEKAKMPRQKKMQAHTKRVKQPTSHPLPEVTDVQEGQWVAVAYETGWFPGMVVKSNIVTDNSSLKKATIKFLHPSLTQGYFRWPKTDTQDVELKFVFSKLEAPMPVSGGRAYFFSEWKVTHEQFKIYSMKYFD